MTTNKSGDIPQDDDRHLGLFMKDTRFLSRMQMFINGNRPVLLSTNANENELTTILLTNGHVDHLELQEGDTPLWRESIELKRSRFIYDDALYENASLKNYFPKPVRFRFTVVFDADFNDMFIIRGFQTGQVGHKRKSSYEKGKLILTYDDAKDGIVRETRISWDTEESKYEESGTIHFWIELSPKETKTIMFFIAPYHNGRGAKQRPMEAALKLLNNSYVTWNKQTTQVKSDLPLFDKLYNRGVRDMRVLLTDLGFGAFPVAGLPWFAVPFGRDSLIAALQMLAVNPEIARGTLLTMAHYQGTQVDEWRDEQPGKIMHEIRFGELANTNQIPFTPYYGTVDATPLFLLLLAEYYQWTEDISIVKELMPNIVNALNWMNEYGDADKDSFVEYSSQSSKGLHNQGWKDSEDSNIHDNGEYAQAPIALIEVQGYIYQAKTKLIPILRLLGKNDLADKLVLETALLKERFELAFWMDEDKYYTIALDREKKQVRSITSNPGHILMSGIADPVRAAHVAQRLVSKDLFSGYGIRTMSNNSTGYNPMSYHDGSVWPHDNSICLLGLSACGFHKEANMVIEGLLKAAQCFEFYRLPELFCGHGIEQEGLIPYPVACSPQAWAAGTPLVFMQAMLGIKPDAVNKCIQLDPSLPKGMNELWVEHLSVARGYLSLAVKRQDNGKLKLDILQNTTGYQVKCKLGVH